eukprot:CAMPEP_0115835680 /NCGR_PEP_ID=MMETSP0287-20121206/4319_1 /TAXON_ID=412157 /ORGANISM="Chrysochromulina rotalis, Strain UIO044" /LENGTH=103 /DNA_ID=CAMNT_0003289145 /DNA_START=774 /DNA_END=1082 /DNA_ORIENTATION=-
MKLDFFAGEGKSLPLGSGATVRGAAGGKPGGGAGGPLANAPSEAAAPTRRGELTPVVPVSTAGTLAGQKRGTDVAGSEGTPAVVAASANEARSSRLDAALNRF